MSGKLWGTVALLIGIQGVAGAQDAEPWAGEVEAGLVITGGNTETQNIHTKAAVVNTRAQWRHTGKFEALQSEDSNTTTAERYRLSGQSDYRLDEISYIFGTIEYEDDRFSGYDYRASEVIGYGRRVLKTRTMSLNLEAGAGARQSKLETTGDTENESMLRGAGNYEWQISETTVFTEELTIDAGEDTTISRSVTGLKTQMVGSLATKITLTVKHTSDVPPGIEKTDTQTAVTLVYSF